jgi:energy-coupling factor transporter ATP-binding protein EcfA2
MDREIVVVTGAPGSGKSTLARHLARILQMNLISKDLIKESLWDDFQPAVGDLEWSRRLDAAAMEVFWALAAQSQRAVLETDFRPQNDSEKAKFSGLSARLVEVYCSCPSEVALRRHKRRATQAGLHPAHVAPTLDAPFLAECDQPIGLGSVIEVDTTQVIDIEELAKVISADLADPADLRTWLGDKGYFRAANAGMAC